MAERTQWGPKDHEREWYVATCPRPECVFRGEQEPEWSAAQDDADEHFQQTGHRAEVEKVEG